MNKQYPGSARTRLILLFAGLAALGLILGPPSSAAASVRSVADLDSLKSQAAQGKKLVVVFLSSSSPNCYDCVRMRKDYLGDHTFSDWINRFAVYGELDVNVQGKSAKEAASISAAREATHCPLMPAMVLLNSDGQMLEYQPVDHVPSQAANLFHEIYLAKIGNIHSPNSAPVTFEPPPGQPGVKSSPAPAPDWAPPNAVPVRYDNLRLRSITGSGTRRFVLINDQTLAVGESRRVTLGAKKVMVQCLEIREGQAVVQIDGEAKPKLLILESARKLAGAPK